MNKEDLKNCPFCNERPNIESKFTGRKGVLTIVKCPKCRAQRVDRGFRSSIIQMEERAIKQWNDQYADSQTEALKKEIEELKKKTEWISVEDKLPNEFTSVLVVGGDIRSCALYRDKKFYTDFPLPTNEEITHWMPLTAPPKQ